MASADSAVIPLPESHSHPAATLENGSDIEKSGNAQTSAVEDSFSTLPPDDFLPGSEASRAEIWSYYAWYSGCNGLSLFNFAPTQFQNLLYIAAGSGDNPQLYFAGANRTVESIVLLANGISFAIQSALFVIIGSYADFGTSRPWILIFWSIVAFGIGFGWMGAYTGDQWQVGAGLYIVGLIAYQMCITFWTAAFPGLARNTPQLQAKAQELTTGQITRQEYDTADMLIRTKISNIAFLVQSVVEIVVLCIILGMLFGLGAENSVDQNNYSLSALIAFATGFWVLVAIPWFFIEKRRPGRKVPPGMNIIAVGFYEIGRAFSIIWRLKQSLIYLIGYFLLGDSLNTTVTVVGTLQSSVANYGSIQLTYLLIVGIAAQALGIYSFWFIQQRYTLSTKTMFNAVIVGILILDIWGMIGNWTTAFGYHNLWEFWLYQVVYGFVCPWYSYSQIMISEVCPRGYEFIFFSLYSIIGKTSSFIGPLVSTAIIGATPGGLNNSAPFYFLFALTLVSGIGLVFFVDLEKARREQDVFLAEEKARLEGISPISANSIEVEKNLHGSGEKSHAFP